LVEVYVAMSEQEVLEYARLCVLVPIGRETRRTLNLRFNGEFNRITKEDNVLLVGRITEEDVKLAVWSCNNDKSPGPKGFNFGFIKFCWEEIKADIMRVVHNFEKDERWPRG